MNEITLHKFPENREKTIYRRLDSLKKVIPEMVEEYNGNKTADDRRKTLENLANIIGIIQSVIFVFNSSKI